MDRVVLEFVRASTGSVLQIEIKKPVGSGPFAFVEGFNGFEIRAETRYIERKKNGKR
ncbi:MAG: hypothetical protein ACYSUB_01950 [Planctomycetota bacterium]|jgi:hypothetical protein